MNEETGTLATIIQGGAVGISIILIFFGWKMFNTWIEFVKTTLEKFEGVLNSNTDANKKLVEVVEKLINKLN